MLWRLEDERQIETANGYFDQASMHPALELIGGLKPRRPVVRTRKTDELIPFDQVDPGKFCGIAPNSRLRQWACYALHVAQKGRPPAKGALRQDEL